MRWILGLAVCVAGMVVFAACSGGDDPSPGDLAGVWEYESGPLPDSGPYGKVSVYDWPEEDHCDWAPLMLLRWRPDGGPQVQFMRAAETRPNRLPTGEVVTIATVPAEAEDTGYSKNGARLFATPALDFIWIVFDDHVEQWPRQDPALACG